MTYPPLPVAFINSPAMLWWAAAAAAPLVIHLLSKRKYREVPWAAMQYLLAALRKNSRRIQIEQWILLAVRTLLILLLVLALAEPFLERASLGIGSGAHVHRVLVIDGSFSMGYKPTDKSRFDLAKELAQKIVDKRHRQGDAWSLVLMADPPKVVVGPPAFDQRKFSDLIEGLRLPHGGGDLPATLVQVEQLIDKTRKEHPRLTDTEVFFLSDLGRTSWDPELRGEAVATEFHQRSVRLGQTASIYVSDLGQTNAENMAVTELAAAEPLAILSRGVKFTGQVRNFGRQQQDRQLVELWVDGRRVGEKNISLKPGETVAVEFEPYRFEAIGDHAVELRLLNDALSIDNHRWLSTRVKENLRVLCIDGKPSGAGSHQTASLLQTILSGHASPLPIASETASESALLEYELGTYDCVFLANVAQFTQAEVKVLDLYLKHGGRLIFFLGDQVQADNYNRRLTGDSADGVHILPVNLESPAPEGLYYFNPLGYQHPLLSVWKGQDNAGLASVPILRYYKVRLKEGSTAKTALGFNTGDPAIVEEPIGHGRSIVVATNADPDWSALSGSGNFAAMIGEMLELVVRGQGDEHNVVVGQALGESLRALAGKSSVSVKTPTGESNTVRVTPEGDYSHWSFDDTSTSGVYAVTYPTSTISAESFAVNVDTTESNLDKLDKKELVDRVWAGVPLVDLQEVSDELVQPTAGRNLLHQTFLMGVLGLLFLETYLAWMFGRRSV
jgi:hypothetical protein